jgi:hypothetical protein
MHWFRLRHSIPEKVLADLFYVSVGSVNAILKTWCILINSVFMKLPIYPTTEEFNSVCPEKLKKKCFLGVFFKGWTNNNTPTSYNIFVYQKPFIYHNLIPWFYEVFGATFTENFWI